jgi:hypothetical protein
MAFSIFSKSFGALWLTSTALVACNKGNDAAETAADGRARIALPSEIQCVPGVEVTLSQHWPKEGHTFRYNGGASLEELARNLGNRKIQFQLSASDELLDLWRHHSGAASAFRWQT